MDNEKIIYNNFYDECPKPLDNISHCHSDYEIIYVVDGKGRYVLEGVEYELCANTLMVFCPNQFHYVDVSPKCVYHRHVIRFDKSFLRKDSEYLVKRLDEKISGAGNFYSAMDIPVSVLSVFERLNNLSLLPEAEAKIMTKMLLGELLVLLSVASPTENKEKNEPLGEKVVRYLNENISADLSLDELAKRFSVSKFYLCRAFKAHNGVSVAGYISNKRIMLAKKMIDSGESASNAALRVGFGDYSSFYRAYKKTLGHSPKKTALSRERTLVQYKNKD